MDMTKQEKKGNECSTSDVVCEWVECEKNNNDKGVELFYTNDTSGEYDTKEFHILCEEHWDKFIHKIV